jgi:hypothetical protein
MWLNHWQDCNWRAGYIVILPNHGQENRENGGQGALFVPKDTKSTSLKSFQNFVSFKYNFSFIIK